MKKASYLLLLSGLVEVSACGGKTLGDISAPRIEFATVTHDFCRVKARESVHFSFIYTNVGAQPIEVAGVRPNCSYTVAGQWTRHVAPGATGTIPIQLTIGQDWPSGPLEKTVMIDSNDPTHPAITLTVKARVWKVIDVIPENAVLKIPAESPSPISTILEITNNTNEPLILSQPEISHRSFTAQLKTNRPGQEFRLTVTANPPFSLGTIEGKITLKTSSPAMPEIRVNAVALVQPTLVVMPPQITLPAPPRSTRTPPTITLQNNGPDPLTLSDPRVSAKDVTVEMKELDPGHSFVLKIIFPQPFKLPEGKGCELTVRCSHPKFPVIKVPIIQMAQ